MKKDEYKNLSGKTVTINTDPEISPIQKTRVTNRDKQIEAATKYKNGGLVTRGSRKNMGKAC